MRRAGGLRIIVRAGIKDRNPPEAVWAELQKVLHPSRLKLLYILLTTITIIIIIIIIVVIAKSKNSCNVNSCNCNICSSNSCSFNSCNSSN